ncbi:hypothetical protein RCH23_003482 [Cryobacterium sp. CAN_C3]|nr:hypothetical protein [Cryobacterium sp. CAN_C3]
MTVDPHDDHWAYSWALEDPAFLAAVREAFSGHGDVINALWWASRPVETAPDGTPSPLAELHTLQRQAFSLGGGLNGDPKTAQAIRTLQAEIDSEHKAITTAVRSAQEGMNAPVLVTRGEVAGATPTEGQLERVDGPAPAHTGRRARNGFIAAGIVAASLVGFIGGTQVGSRSVTTPNTELATDATRPVQSFATASVFARPQTGDDIPEQLLPGSLEVTSFRVLTTSGLLSYGAYAARSGSAVCLVVLVSETDFISGCAPADDFPADGMHLNWSSATAFPDTNLSVTWKRDGTLEAGGGVRD